MSLEIPGLVLGAVGILTAFKGALDTALLIESFFDDDKAGCGYLALRYHIEKTHLNLWRQVCNLDNVSMCILRNKPTLLQETVLGILGEITRLLEEAEKLVKKHGIAKASIPSMPDEKGTVRTENDVIMELSTTTVKPKARLRWTIKGKAEFEEKVSRLRQLIKDLYSFTIGASGSETIHRALPSMALSPISSGELLQTLRDPKMEIDATLALSARVKLLQTELAQSPDGYVTIISSDQLRLFSSKFGTLRSYGVGYISVWVEWGLVSDGAEADEYVRRIKALGYLLEQAGEPALRLPTCYGVFEDLKYEVGSKNRRLGFVFGPPRANCSRKSSLLTPAVRPPLPMYESNFHDHPPRTLRDLIRDQKSTPIPVLGDRFSLAFALATAFSHFHSSKWLHKGFHSGNIVFIAHTSKSNSSDTTFIDVKDPFITGFQYSRPEAAHSLSRGPLENRELEYYYHPSADKGFSRRIDLYSLGVVLCEIGRWGLVADTVSERRRQKMVDRGSWRDYILKNVLTDIGWRMGERYQRAVRTLLEYRLPDDDDSMDGGLFEQQYFEKIIQPLGECSA